MAPLPPRGQRHLFLRYQGLDYTDADIADFEKRMVMEHRDDAGGDVFTSQAWGRLFDTRGPLVRELILEFLSTLRFGEFILALGLHIGEEMESLSFARYWSESERMIPGKGDLHDYWRDISNDGDFLGPPPSYTLIRDPVLRLYHQMMAHSIAGRSQAPEKVIATDLLYLRRMDVGSVNIPYLLARYLRRFIARRKSGAHISGGQFIARLAEHFGLLTAEILEGLTITALIQIIDMAELPDVAAGALEVAQDAPIIDEGGQADSAPTHAPPPPAAARTMIQRMARLEANVHEISGTLTEQRELISAMAHDFSRFCTWTTTSLTRMMDREGVTYKSYSETLREYTRHVRCRTYGASTSAAQQDPQQPDP
ncbi:hypothetical protein Tco_0979928 [Tanacetum coccineum]